MFQVQGSTFFVCHSRRESASALAVAVAPAPAVILTPSKVKGKNPDTINLAPTAQTFLSTWRGVCPSIPTVSSSVWMGRPDVPLDCLVVGLIQLQQI
jgi:hypothetical protein